MDCGITVLDRVVAVLNPATGEVTAIEIRGYALYAAQVHVSLKQRPAGQVTTIGPIDVVNGWWSAVFEPEIEYTCWTYATGLEVGVTAEAEDCDPVLKQDVPFLVVCRTGASCEKSTRPLVAEPEDECSGECRPITLSTRYSPPRPGLKGYFELNTGDASPPVYQDQSTGNFVYDGFCLPVGDYVARFYLDERDGCDEAVAFSIEPCPCASSLELRILDAATDATVLVINDGGGFSGDGNAAPPECLPPGIYKARAIVTPSYSGDFAWYLDDSSSAVPNRTEFELPDIVLGDVDPRRIEVRATPPNCDLTQLVWLVPCRDEPEPVPCPAEFEIRISEHVTGGGGRPVLTITHETAAAEAICLPPGSYDLEVVSPRDEGLTYRWSDAAGAAISEDALLAGYELTEDHANDGILTVRIDSPPDCTLTPAIELRVCICPANLRIVITRDWPEPAVLIEQEDCVAPGQYHAEVVGDGLDDAEFTWTRNNRVRADKGRTHSFDIKTSVKCFGITTSQHIQVSAKHKKNPDACAGASAERTIDLCEEFVFCIPCWLLRMFIVMMIGFVAVGAVFLLCPGVGDQSLLRWVASKLTSEPRAAAALMAVWGYINTIWQGVRVGVVIAAFIAMFVGAAATILYIAKCKPKWCYDWCVLLWQALLQAGFLFFYYGSCEGCLPFGVIGALMMFVGVLVMFYWVATCRPNACRVLFEFASVGAINQVLVQGAIYYLLGACTWHYGMLIHAAWNWMSFIAASLAALCLLLSAAYNMTNTEGE